eukprot:1746658-Prymnesium_polylepis.1
MSAYWLGEPSCGGDVSRGRASPRRPVLGRVECGNGWQPSAARLNTNWNTNWSHENSLRGASLSDAPI